MRKNNSRYWLFQAIGWGGFLISFVLFAFLFGQSKGDSFLRQLIFSTLGVIFSHLMRLLIIRIGLLQKSLNKQIFQFFLISFFLAFLASFFYVEIMDYSGLLRQGDVKILERENISYMARKGLVVLNNAFFYFLLFFIWNLLYFVYHYVEKSRKQQLDTLQLESLVKELELKTIKAHINPHFIFNSLNSIRALVDENPERARTAITELSNILRSSMRADKSESILLQREMDIVKDYLALENMRFEDRLKIEYEIEPGTLALYVPPMMLQTLVENAIKHGISKQIHGGIVKVISFVKDGFHILAVQNTGLLNGSISGEGFGLSSTTNRLNLLYGNKAKFEIKQIAPAMVEARVVIPFETNH